MWSPHLNIWELIFDWPCVGRSMPVVKCWFHRWLCVGSHTASADHLKLHLQIYPPVNGSFTDSFCDSSYFIPTLKTYIWQTRYWQIYPPQTSVSQIPPLTAHISFLLWKLILADLPPTSNGNDRFLLRELIFGRPSVGRSTPPHG